MKIKKHIEIVRSGTPRLSSLGLKSCVMIREVLSQYYDSVRITYINNENDLNDLIERKPDLVFLGFKNMPSTKMAGKTRSDIWICEELDNAGINYTGSDKEAMLLDHNKEVAKGAVQAAGLQTAEYFSAKPNQYKKAEDLPLDFPLFIKPPQEGGGTGIDDNSVIHDFSGFEDKVAAIDRLFGTPALVEKYLVGREFSVAIFETDQRSDLLVMPIELISEPNKNGDQILSRKVKSEDTEHVIAVEPGSLRDALILHAAQAFRVLGARDYGRIDIRMDEAGTLNFLEANLIPGVAQHDFTSYFTSACVINESISYDDMILNIIELGLSHGLYETEDTLGLEDSVSSTSSPVITAL